MTQLPRADEVSRILREILAGPEFNTFEAPGRWGFVEWVLGKVGDLWEWMRSFMGEDATWLQQALVILVPVAVVVLAARIVSGHGQRLRVRAPDDVSDGPGVAPATAGEWLQIASRRAGSGELRPAATALYQGFLLTLEQRGTLVFHSSKTPGDYTLEIAGSSDGGVLTGNAGTSFLDSFQDFSFGQERPTDTGYAGLARLAREAGCGAEAPDPETAPGE